MRVRLLCSVLMVLSSATVIFAQESATKGLQLSLFSPYQTVPAEDSITGVRLGIFYTVNRDVTGFSLTIIGVNRTTNNGEGIELGLANFVDGDFRGMQWGLVNYTGNNFTGFQDGWVNIVNGECAGTQWGLFNYAASMKGFQLGLINWTKSLNGVQIGLGNYNGNKKPFEFLPIVNWSF